MRLRSSVAAQLPCKPKRAVVAMHDVLVTNPLVNRVDVWMHRGHGWILRRGTAIFDEAGLHRSAIAGSVALYLRTGGRRQRTHDQEPEHCTGGAVVSVAEWPFCERRGRAVSRGEVFVERTDENLAILASVTGSGITFGVGFDIPVFKWLSVTANFEIYFGAIGDLVVQDTYVDDVITTMYNTILPSLSADNVVMVYRQT